MLRQQQFFGDLDFKIHSTGQTATVIDAFAPPPTPQPQLLQQKEKREGQRKRDEGSGEKRKYECQTAYMHRIPAYANNLPVCRTLNQTFGSPQRTTLPPPFTPLKNPENITKIKMEGGLWGGSAKPRFYQSTSTLLQQKKFGPLSLNNSQNCP